MLITQELYILVHQGRSFFENFSWNILTGETDLEQRLDLPRYICWEIIHIYIRAQCVLGCVFVQDIGSVTFLSLTFYRCIPNVFLHSNKWVVRLFAKTIAKTTQAAFGTNVARRNQLPLLPNPLSNLLDVQRFEKKLAKQVIAAFGTSAARKNMKPPKNWIIP